MSQHVNSISDTRPCKQTSINQARVRGAKDVWRDWDWDPGSQPESHSARTAPARQPASQSASPLAVYYSCHAIHMPCAIFHAYVIYAYCLGSPGRMKKYCFPLDLQITAATEAGAAAPAPATAAAHLDLSSHFNAGTEKKIVLI